MSGSLEDDQASNRSNQPPRSPADSPETFPSSAQNLQSESIDADDPLAVLEALTAPPSSPQEVGSTSPRIKTTTAPLVLVETAFLASTASLLWLASYYLSLVPWMRIIFPVPIALVYLRWGRRAAWISALVTALLLSVLMGPYLSLLFMVPYGALGVQLGALWRRQTTWLVSISFGTLIATIGFFFRVWLLSIFLGEDLWVYLTNRITDLLEWFLNRLVGWGLLDIGAIGQIDVHVVQIFTVGMILASDFVYLFTVHIAAWLLLERLGNPIPTPPGWVQVLLEEEH